MFLDEMTTSAPIPDAGGFTDRNMQFLSYMWPYLKLAVRVHMLGSCCMEV
jgi:hypothetical protein